MTKFLEAIDDTSGTESEWIKRVVTAFAGEQEVKLTYAEAIEYFVTYGIGRVAALQRAKAKKAPALLKSAKAQAKISDGGRAIRKEALAKLIAE